MASDNTEPPYYVLLSQSTLPDLTLTNPLSTTFVHPVIEYHFADDPPAALLPKSPSESVIILDYEGPNVAPVAQSLESNLAVTGVRVADAPRASAARDGEPRRNEQIYIIETINGVESSTEASLHQSDNPQLILARFKERNAHLKKVLDSPSPESRIIRDTQSPSGGSKVQM